MARANTGSFGAFSRRHRAAEKTQVSLLSVDISRGLS
jgi:hypothetical protein